LAAHRTLAAQRNGAAGGLQYGWLASTVFVGVKARLAAGIAASYVAWQLWREISNNGVAIG